MPNNFNKSLKLKHLKDQKNKQNKKKSRNGQKIVPSCLIVIELMLEPLMCLRAALSVFNLVV